MSSSHYHKISSLILRSKTKSTTAPSVVIAAASILLLSQNINHQIQEKQEDLNQNQRDTTKDNGDSNNIASFLTKDRKINPSSICAPDINNDLQRNYYNIFRNNNTRLFSPQVCHCDDDKPRGPPRKIMSIRSLERKLTIQGIQSFLSHSSFKTKYDVNFNAPPLGEGGFGAVYLAIDKNTGEKLALKKIDKMLTDNDTFLKEMRALLHIKAYGGHPHISALREYFEEGDYYYLILDLVSGGEMFDHLVTLGAYSEADAARLLREVASAMAFLHGIGVVHGDLKPENLMLSTSKSSDCVIKVVDFGCADVLQIMEEYYDYLIQDFDYKDVMLLQRAQKARYDANQVVEISTPAYSPPEVIKGTKKHPSTDMWAIGVILYIMLTGLHPFDFSGQSTDAQMARRIVEHEAPPLRDSPVTSHLSDSALDVIERLMSWDDNTRLTAQQMLDHPWIRGETAKTDIIADSDKKLSLFRKFRTKLEAKIFADILSWSNPTPEEGQIGNNNGAATDIRQKTSLLERAFQNLDLDKKGFLDSNDLISITGDDDDGGGHEHDDKTNISLSDFSNLLSENMKNVYFSKGQTAYNEGDSGNHMYFINSGVIQVATKDGSCKQRRQGDFFGEGALLHPKAQRSATITCLTPVHAIQVSREYFEKYLASDTGLKTDLREKDKLRKRQRAKAILRLQSDLKSEYKSKGDFLFKEGESGDELYILEHGTVDVQIQGNTVFSIGEGGICGEYSVIMGKPRNCDAVCTSPTCKVLTMKTRDFYALLDSSSTTIGCLREMCLRREVRKALVRKLRKKFPSVSDLKEAFDAADTDSSGIVSVSELEELLLTYDPTFKPEDIQELFHSMGLDKKSGVCFSEFKKIFGMEA